MGMTAYDLIIVGSGAGALVAAVTAKAAGLQPLLIEKTELIGGSTALSGGILWLPNNPLMAREGIADSRAESITSLANFTRDEDLDSTPARRAAFVDAIPEMIAAMETQGMKYRNCPGYCDYYDHLPGGNAFGRSIQAELFNLNELGAWKSRFRRSPGAMPLKLSPGTPSMFDGSRMPCQWMEVMSRRRLLTRTVTVSPSRQRRVGAGRLSLTVIAGRRRPVMSTGIAPMLSAKSVPVATVAPPRRAGVPAEAGRRARPDRPPKLELGEESSQAPESVAFSGMRRAIWSAGGILHAGIACLVSPVKPHRIHSERISYNAHGYAPSSHWPESSHRATGDPGAGGYCV